MSPGLHHSTSPAGRPRHGFTLVELMVVISIIAILTALLIPAVFFAINSAKRARITLEVAALAKALERYKLETGEYPPDFSELAEPTLNTALLKAEKAIEIINAHMGRVYRRRATGQLSGGNLMGGDWPQNMEGLTDLTTNTRNVELLANLSPKNALYFWLRGFSEDPQYPLFKVGAKEPLTDFDPARLTQVSGSVPFYAEYHPQGDSLKKPYIYYNANSYDGTNPAANPPVIGSAYVFATNDSEAPIPYSSSTTNTPAEQGRFQIISAGLDGVYGFTSGAQVSSLQVPTVPNGNHITPPHRDNITNFTGGTIEDFLED